MLQNMNDLQTVAFKPSAYDPIADRKDGKEKLKEVEIQKEGGNREQNLVKTVLKLKETDNAETYDPIQDGLQQRNNRPACKCQDLSLIRFRFFLGNEITAHRDKGEDDFRRADDRRSGSRDYLPFGFPTGDPISQGMARFMQKYG